MEPWVEALLGPADELSSQTRCQYDAALRYWAEWHRLRYGRRLPLASGERLAPDTKLLADFFADHTPRFENGSLHPAMSAQLADGLVAAGFNRRGACPSASTTAVRVAALSRAVRGVGRTLDASFVTRALSSLKSQWAAESAAAGCGGSVPVSAATATEQLLAACDLDSLTGAQDAALVLLCQRLAISQAVALRYSEVRPGTIRAGYADAGATCVGINITSPATQFQRLHPTVLYRGEEADVLSVWGAHLQSSNVPAERPFLDGPRRRTGDREGWARRRFRTIALRAGFPTGRGRNAMTPGRFRRMWESEARQATTGMELARRAHLSERSALRLMNTFRIRHQPWEDGP